MKLIGIAAGLLALLGAACTLVTAPPGAETAAQSEAVTLAPSGDAAELGREQADENLAWATSVARLDPLTNEANSGAKLFGLAGGDPAMNGLLTYLAFYENPAEGWQVFRLGDFLEYRVLSEAPNRLDLEIQESTYDEASGEIGSRTRHAIVTWTGGADGAPPTTITVTPAQPAG
ncbi:MAG: hypothetical protein AB7T59_06735 [Hyphomonadaceae bacterium]